MKKLLTALCVAATLSAPAQTLFTYGKDTVSAPAFLLAFQKNNQGAVTERGLQEYLDLYIASRLKIKEAQALGYDTLPQLLADLASLRQQILPAYLHDKEGTDKMIGEAFTRSQKDIHLAHIFIKKGDGAEKKKEAALQAIARGDFAAAAKTYSDDPSASTNGGDLGWITVFSLPYPLENLAYATASGKTSPVFTSPAGYHIFKNLGERKALGRIRAAQILLAFPPNSTADAKARLKQTADSLYRRILAGDDFGSLAANFSNDVVSAAANGEMAEFGVGDYDPAFEMAVLQLSADSAVSQPFATAHGYHIVKRLKVLPVPATLDDETKDALRQRIEQSDRSRVLKQWTAQKVLKQTGYAKASFTDAELQAYTDSVLLFQVPKTRVTLLPSTPLLKIGSSTATVANWTEFAQGARYHPNGNGARPQAEVWEDFVQAMALNYYQDHLEEFNEDFRRQITEFAEGNLFFEIMQRQVWAPAQSDSTGLARHYQQHKSRYTWNESANAIVFYASDETAANAFYEAIRSKPAGWRTLLTEYAEQITADSNRFELAQLPRPKTQPLTAGTLTEPVVNKDDNTVSFAYILQLYPTPEPRSFADAKGLVINDYQAQLEKEWVEKLKKKYPVKLNGSVWKEVVKNAMQ